MKSLSKIDVDFYKKEVDNFDYVVYELLDGDISKLSQIEDIKEVLVGDWFYVKKTNDLNKMKMDLEQIKTISKH